MHYINYYLNWQDLAWDEAFKEYELMPENLNVDSSVIEDFEGVEMVNEECQFSSDYMKDVFK